MQIRSVFDPEFAPYGRVLQGYDTQAIVQALANSTPLPQGVEYVPVEPALQSLTQAAELALALYGGQPTQFGWCNGHNTKLNCLEYHRDSEFNLGSEDFVLLVAKESDIVGQALDTACVQAFRAPAGVLVEVYATTLHYAPCHADPAKGFRVMIALPQGTNGPKPALEPKTWEDRCLRACNKWLLAHPDSAEAQDGAVVALTGPNPDIAPCL